MDQDVIEAECQIAASAAMQANERACQIAYAQEGERLIAASAAMLANRQANRSRAPFLFYHHLRSADSASKAKLFNKPLTSRYRFFKRGGLYFVRFGSFQLSFCKVKPC